MGDMLQGNPTLDRLWTKWAKFQNNPNYEPINDALNAGWTSMKKWYKKIKTTPMYFISHGQ
jgi:hypothetical protein